MSSFTLIGYLKIHFSFIFFSNSMSVVCAEDTLNTFMHLNAHPDSQVVRYVVLTLGTPLCTRHLWKELIECGVGCYFHYRVCMFLFFKSTDWIHLSSRRHTPMTSAYCLMWRSSEHCYQISVISMPCSCSFTVRAVLNQLVGSQ